MSKRLKTEYGAKHEGTTSIKVVCAQHRGNHYCFTQTAAELQMFPEKRLHIRSQKMLFKNHAFRV